MHQLQYNVKYRNPRLRNIIMIIYLQLDSECVIIQKQQVTGVWRLGVVCMYIYSVHINRLQCFYINQVYNKNGLNGPGQGPKTGMCMITGQVIQHENNKVNYITQLTLHGQFEKF